MILLKWQINLKNFYAEETKAGCLKGIRTQICVSGSEQTLKAEVVRCSEVTEEEARRYFLFKSWGRIIFSVRKIWTPCRNVSHLSLGLTGEDFQRDLEVLHEKYLRTITEYLPQDNYRYAYRDQEVLFVCGIPQLGYQKCLCNFYCFHIQLIVAPSLQTSGLGNKPTLFWGPTTLCILHKNQYTDLIFGRTSTFNSVLLRKKK